jgi:hypothetical protein
VGPLSTVTVSATELEGARLLDIFNLGLARGVEGLGDGTGEVKA